MHARLLGALEVDDGRTPVPLGAPGERALLARLLLDANRTVPVDRLVDDCWGQAVPDTAVKILHVRVSRLRKVLPAGALVTRAPGYAAQIGPEALDLVRFDRLREQGRAALAGGSTARAAALLRDALALWRGPALAEFGEPFAAIEGRRLEELRLACIEDRIDADLALGAHARLIGELDALVGRHPLRERLRGQLMLALYRSGRQAEALAAYRELARALSTELGLEPWPALRVLERRILQQDAGLDLAAARAAHRHAGRRTASSRGPALGIRGSIGHAPRRGCFPRRPT
jgi:DNA-binding SARP family transcriptional activator